uniref:Uncharacterized protein n=1 Tax=Anopheles darlingi TaxID=43151 RepID=A0A2M4DIZ3_ANODA
MVAPPLLTAFGGAVAGRSFRAAAGILTVMTARSQHSLIFAIFSASTSVRYGAMVFSPTSFIAVPIASADASRTPGSDSLSVLSRAATIGLMIFFDSAVGIVLVKERARNDAVSIFTLGFLFPSASSKSSRIASSVVAG